MPRTNILAYTLPGFATSETTKSNAWRLMKALGVSGAEIDIRPAARQMLDDIGHASAKGEALYDVTFENVQAGLRTDYLFRLANHNGGAGGRHRRPLRTRSRVVHLRGRRPDVALQPERIGGQDPDPAPDPLCRGVGRCWARTRAPILYDILATEISPELVPPGADGADPVDREHRRPLRVAGFQPLLRDALRLPPVQDRLSVVERLAATRPAAAGPPTPRRRRAAPTRSPRSSTGCGSFSTASSS